MSELEPGGWHRSFRNCNTILNNNYLNPVSLDALRERRGEFHERSRVLHEIIDSCAGFMSLHMHPVTLDTTLPIPRTVRGKYPGIEINQFFPGHSTPRCAARLLKHGMIV